MIMFKVSVRFRVMVWAGYRVRIRSGFRIGIRVRSGVRIRVRVRVRALEVSDIMVLGLVARPKAGSGAGPVSDAGVTGSWAYSVRSWMLLDAATHACIRRHCRQIPRLRGVPGVPRREKAGAGSAPQLRAMSQQRRDLC